MQTNLNKITTALKEKENMENTREEKKVDATSTKCLGNQRVTHSRSKKKVKRYKIICLKKIIAAVKNDRKRESILKKKTIERSQLQKNKGLVAKHQDHQQGPAQEQLKEKSHSQYPQDQLEKRAHDQDQSEEQHAQQSQLFQEWQELQEQTQQQFQQSTTKKRAISEAIDRNDIQEAQPVTKRARVLMTYFVICITRGTTAGTAAGATPAGTTTRTTTRRTATTTKRRGLESDGADVRTGLSKFKPTEEEQREIEEMAREDLETELMIAEIYLQYVSYIINMV
ncbi:hypothetical protein RFI_05202 [Reticulomyxa filosa]|uniref:Uncharacterized protein n=1 Tax=Reticulomyxa filosa TaxID=46433 RepID=X6P032_RETFI|nr:hypothetical protein RFI_05202 [Reticulomyxa filosa]|eukprot:ETO31915.1 hypothetical protein RFI_05202 [Reticulomyxa filosa]